MITPSEKTYAGSRSSRSPSLLRPSESPRVGPHAARSTASSETSVADLIAATGVEAEVD